MTVWFATGNIHKKKELADILSVEILAEGMVSAAPAAGGKAADRQAAQPEISLKIPADAGLAFAPEETGNTFLENALIKAGALYRLLEEHRPSLYTRGDPIIADDSGICVDALGGRPGIFSARYGGAISDTERNARLLAEVAALGGKPSRSASFVCAMVLYYGPRRFFAAVETLDGELVAGEEASRGTGGFGYDPVLYIPALGRTVAELSDEEKNRHSHRGKAGRVVAKIIASTGTPRNDGANNARE